jgi:hypothetical protein
MSPKSILFLLAAAALPAPVFAQDSALADALRPAPNAPTFEAPVLSLDQAFSYVNVGAHSEANNDFGLQLEGEI